MAGTSLRLLTESVLRLLPLEYRDNQWWLTEEFAQAKEGGWEKSSPLAAATTCNGLIMASCANPVPGDTLAFAKLVATTTDARLREETKKAQQH